MQPIHRRRMLIMAATVPVVAGCERETVDETIAATETEMLEQGTVVLRGFAIVAYVVGARVVMLPTPGVRILGIALIISSVATKLAVEYLDIELKKRYIAENLEESEARQLESDLAVTFQLENGETEQVPLGANRYESDESSG